MSDLVGSFFDGQGKEASFTLATLNVPFDILICGKITKKVVSLNLLISVAKVATLFRNQIQPKHQVTPKFSSNYHSLYI